MKPTLTLAALIIILSQTISANEFEEFKRQQLEGRLQQKQEFIEYKNKQDAEFASFLKQDWKRYRTQAAPGNFEQPKPDVLPTLEVQPVEVFKAPPPVKIIPTITKLADPIKKQQEPELVEQDEKINIIRRDEPETIKPDALVKQTQQEDLPVLAPIEIKLPEINKPPLPQIVKAKPTKPKRNEKSVVFFYYGNKLQLNYPENFHKRLPFSVNKDVIADYWSKLANSEFESALNYLQTFRKQTQLNDWAYLVLLDHFGSAIHADRDKDKNALLWFLLVKSGYKARLGYDKTGNVFLLLPTQQKIQFAYFYTYNGQRYYVLHAKGGVQPRAGSLYSYEGDHPDSKYLVDLKLDKAILTQESTKHRDISFAYGGNDYSFALNYDLETVKFLQTYPQVNYEVFFTSDVHRTVREQLLAQLRPVVKTMDQASAANFLLRLTQKAFKYETDQKQFGYEDSLFPEETLFYPASDCEDRSYFYAWLVRHLLDLPVVGIVYPNHMAVAVHFKEKQKGDGIKHKGKYYTITDPTYINADIGMAMPHLKKEKNLQIVEI